jgi:hypothetical protein
MANGAGSEDPGSNWEKMQQGICYVAVEGMKKMCGRIPEPSTLKDESWKVD